MGWVLLGIWWLAAAALVVAWRRTERQEQVRRRWHTLSAPARDADQEHALSPDGELSAPVRSRRLTRQWILVPWLVGLLTASAIALFTPLATPYVLSIGVLVALTGSQIESLWSAQVVAALESQLADAIDIMIGAVGAGASVPAAIDAAIVESGRRLRPYLEELSGRIRLGDDPVEVFRSLAERVPLETFLLFSSALSVHWEVGGRVAPTLTTVGRTIRDRIDVSRRIRSNVAQSQMSTLAIVALTYFIAAVVWRNGPEQMEEFVESSLGSWFVAGSIVLQACGIAWMNAISKPRY